MAFNRLSGRQRRRITEAVAAAEAATGLQFCVYLGPTESEARAHAEAMFQGAGLHQRPSVLILVAPRQRRVEVLTGPGVQTRIDEAACARAVTEMTGHFGRGQLVEGIVAGVNHLAGVAGPGEGSGPPEVPGDGSGPPEVPAVVDDE